MKGLRKKITCLVIVPCIIGLLLSSLFSLGYLYLSYPNWMNKYSDDMIDNQKSILSTQARILGYCGSYSYVQKDLNILNVAVDFMESYLFYGMIVNTDLNNSAIYENYEIYNKNPTNNYLMSLWYYQNFSNETCLPSDVQQYLNDSAYYSDFISIIGNLILNEVYLIESSSIFYNNELIYYNPPNYPNIISSANCPSTDNTCSCSSNSTYFNPTCTNIYNYVLNVTKTSAVIIPPYMFYDGTIGQSVCRGLWNFTTDTMILSHCLDFTIINYLETEIVSSLNNGVSYSFTLNMEGSVITYKDRNQSQIFNKTITELEFGDSTSSRNEKEIDYFNDKIIPICTNQSNVKVTTYKKFGDKMMIAVAPIFMLMSSDDDPVQIGSISMVMKKRHIDSKFSELKDDCSSSLFIRFFILIGLVSLILITHIVLTFKLAGDLLTPIDYLVKILDRLKKGDLEVDVLAAYTESPPEIAALYDVFDKLRVVLRFASIDKLKITEAAFRYTQALILFNSFGNKAAMKVCYLELGYICYKKKMWEESGYYLYQALALVNELKLYDDYDLARLKADIASVFVKTEEKRKEGLVIFKEAIEIFDLFDYYTDKTVCLIEVAESLVSVGEIRNDLVDIIETELEKSNPSERELLRQKFYYVKALNFRNMGKLKSAALMVKSILEDFSEYLPETWVKALDLLSEIGHLPGKEINRIKEIKNQRRNTKKDVVLVVSDYLIPLINPELELFILSILEQSDRFSLLQFNENPMTVYNLSKIPSKLIKIERKCNELFKNKVLLDTMFEGFKQFRLNDYLNNDNRKEWIIVISNSGDCGSKRTVDEVIEEINNSRVGVIFIKCFTADEIFPDIKLDDRVFNRFCIKNEGSIGIVFREIEAYICPHREVYI